MQLYEYKAVPAPDRGEKVKGMKQGRDRFAHSLTGAINALAVEGWEYLRADTLPCEERKGFTGTVTNYYTMLVFRRALPGTAADPAHAAPPARTAVAAQGGERTGLLAPVAAAAATPAPPEPAAPPAPPPVQRGPRPIPSRPAVADAAAPGPASVESAEPAEEPAAAPQPAPLSVLRADKVPAPGWPVRRLFPGPTAAEGPAVPRLGPAEPRE